MNYNPKAIRGYLHTLIIGRKIELHRQVNSTNDLAKEAARRGEPEGLVVLAEEQVRGRGRSGRMWIAPPGSSILCSVLLRPRFSPGQAFYLTIAAALAIYRVVGRWTMDDGRWTIGDRVNRQSAIKWPNDVLVNGRKVAGILSESEFVGGEWTFAVVGFGINANVADDDMERLRAVAPQATSLSTEWGIEVDRAVILARVLSEFEGLYLALQSGQFGPVYDEWASALESVGRRVTVNYGDGVVSGRALRVENDGTLVIKTDAGIERRVLGGDVIE
jgi:BirA family biotin operon repressor/biotin-[acetyl-CoA-carboxylase] ligase